MDLNDSHSAKEGTNSSTTQQVKTSPKSPNTRRQAPLRSLENTSDLKIHCADKLPSPVSMVCKENLDGSYQIKTESNVDNSSVGNSCDQPDQSTQRPSDIHTVVIPTFSHKKEKHVLLSPGPSRASGGHRHRGMMVRSTNKNINVDCLFQNGENIPVNNINQTATKNSSGIRIRTEPFSDFYTVEEEIGRGKFAVVKRCRRNTTGFKYAAKFLRKRRKGKDARAEVMKEVQMLEMAVVHPRLVDLIEVYETSHEVILVTEYAEGGELFQRVVDEENIDEVTVKRLLRQILEGVLFLHERNIVHLDIKPQNILLTGTNCSKANIKLCDLGFARPITSGDDVRDIIGTPDYVAPEILSYEPIHTSSDMWSVGVLTYVMLTGCSPFAGDSKQETFLNISQVNLDFPADLFSNVSEQAVDFISKLLIHTPEERLSAKECLNHPWLQRTPTGSPIGQRRALTPPSPETLAEEPLKKCRCQLSTPSPIIPRSESQVISEDPCDMNSENQNLPILDSSAITGGEVIASEDVISHSENQVIRSEDPLVSDSQCLNANTDSQIIINTDSQSIQNPQEEILPTCHASPQPPQKVIKQLSFQSSDECMQCSKDSEDSLQNSLEPSGDDDIHRNDQVISDIAEIHSPEELHENIPDSSDEMS